jgi:hypothetical protein
MGIFSLELDQQKLRKPKWGGNGGYFSAPVMLKNSPNAQAS